MFTLVPSVFFNAAAARETLAEVAELGEGDIVKHMEIPEYNAILIYTDRDGVDSVPPIADMLRSLPESKEYNKIQCTLQDGIFYLAIAQGKSLMLANCYQATDFSTAEYFLFLAMKSLQLNPELSTVQWRGRLDTANEISLYRYFKSVEQI